MADQANDKLLRGMVLDGATLRMTTEDGSSFEGPLAYISIEGKELWYRFADANGGFQGMEVFQRIDDASAPSITLWLSYGWKAEITPIADLKWEEQLKGWREYASRKRRAGQSVWPIESDLPEGIRYEV